MAVITISRGSASGGLMLAQGLAKELGYRLVSREEVVEQASRFGVDEERLLEAISKPPRFFERLRNDRRRYLAFVQAALCEVAKDDNVVYHGNAGHFLLQGISHVIRVRLIAPLEYRVHMLMKREGLTREQAEEYIENVDRQRAAWTKFLYGVDPLDPHLYDLVVKLVPMTVDDAVKIVAAAAKCPSFQTTPESRKAMEDLCLASKVRAVLAANSETADLDIQVEADGGKVILKGKLPYPSLLDTVVKVASGVEGVEEVCTDYIAAMDYTV